MAGKETAVSAAIRLKLGSRDSVRLWRMNRGDAVRSRATKAGVRSYRIQFGVNGQADLSGIVNLRFVGNSHTVNIGIRLEVEVKKDDKEKLRKDQRNYRDMILEHGGIYIVAWSPEVAEQELHRHLTKKTQEIEACFSR